jgi:hypothetical protein
MTVNTNYIVNGAGRIDMTLPTTSAVGASIRLTNKNAGGYFRVRQPVGKTMYFDQLATTTGLAGYIEVTNNGARASIEIVCVTADSDWNVLSSIGTFTIV